VSRKDESSILSVSWNGGREMRGRLRSLGFPSAAKAGAIRVESAWLTPYPDLSTEFFDLN